MGAWERTGELVHQPAVLAPETPPVSGPAPPKRPLPDRYGAKSREAVTLRPDVRPGRAGRMCDPVERAGCVTRSSGPDV